jgi:hypothetical protein
VGLEGRNVGSLGGIWGSLESVWRMSVNYSDSGI